MNPKLYCFQCMSTLDTEDGRCPHCGHDNRVRTNGSGCLPYSIVNKRYLIGKALGRGGFGVTYIGRDLSLARRVAIKEYLPGELVNRTPGQSALAPYDEGSRLSFERGRERSLEEARTIARLNDVPDAVNVYDVFIANNTLYIVMEYIQGETLAARVRRRGGRLPTAEALALLRPVFRALTLIHTQGIIHRDVSPDNIMFRAKTGRAVLLDFGAAHDYAGGEESEHSTSLRPGYAPVEQYSRYGRQDERTDEYALCATLYFAITGQKPVASMERAFGDVALTAPSALGADITPGMEAVLLKALSINANDRYADIPALEAALDALPDPPVFHGTADGGQAAVDRQRPSTRPDTKPADPAAPDAKARADEPGVQPDAEADAESEGDTFVIDPGAGTERQVAPDNSECTLISPEIAATDGTHNAAAPDSYEHTIIAPETEAADSADNPDETVDTEHTLIAPETEKTEIHPVAGTEIEGTEKADAETSGGLPPMPPEPPRARAGLEPKKRKKWYVRLLWIVALLLAIAAGVYYLTAPSRLANGSGATGKAVPKEQWTVYQTDTDKSGYVTTTYLSKEGWLFIVGSENSLELVGPGPRLKSVKSGALILPDTLNGLPVGTISTTFSSTVKPADAVRELHIPNGVYFITSNTFNLFTKLETVTGGENLYEIDLFDCFSKDSPFYKKAIKSTLILNGTLLVHAVYDGDTAGLSKKKSGSVTVPDGITVLNYDAFRSPNGVDEDYPVTSVTLPSSLQRMSYECLSNFSGTELTIPDGVTVSGNIFGSATQPFPKIKNLWVGKNVSFRYHENAEKSDSLWGSSFLHLKFTGTLHLADGATLPTLTGLFGTDCKYTVDCEKGAILDGKIPKGVTMKYRKQR